MFIHINKSGFSRVIASYLLLSFLFELFAPNLLLANGGVGQTDLYSSPDGGGQMVNPATGDFSYTIPLANLDGYPLNLTYNAGIRPDQEASWVGLGWSLNPGAVTRTMRGIPDEFSGEEKITKKLNFKKNEIHEYSIGGGVELYGKDNKNGKEVAKKVLKKLGVSIAPGIGADFSIRTNNYDGPGIRLGTSASVRVRKSFLKKIIGNNNLSGSYTLGGTLNLDSQFGVSAGLSHNYNLGLGVSKKSANVNFSLSGSRSTFFNSRDGLTLSSSSLTPSLSFVDSKSYINFNIRGTVSGHSDNLPASNYSFSPRIDFPTSTFGFSKLYKIGIELKGLYVHGKFSGSTTITELAGKEREESAYGYFYSHLADDEKGVMDVNREKDQVIRESSKALPLTNLTYDLFNATASGVALNFRAHRNDVGTIRDNLAVSHTNKTSDALEGGFGVIDPLEFELGLNVSEIEASTKSGKWVEHNELQKRLKFSSSDAIGFEKHFFKVAGEQQPVNQSFFTNVGGYDAVRPELEKTSNFIHYATTNKLISGSNDGSPISVGTGGIIRGERNNRATTISYLQADEKATSIISYEENDFNYSNGDYSNKKATISRVAHANQHRKHISEIKVVTANGWRYDYGIPVYNRKKNDYVFKTSQSADILNGLVPYSSAEMSISNPKFYSETSVPDYPEAFLLTTAKSPDYSDITQNGPTPDDLGNYTKFNYYRHASNYRWRIPQEKDKAFYSKGFNSTEADDDKGVVAYGEKELWYLHSMETKNFIAEFHLKARQDGFGVTNVHGGSDASQTQRALDKIKIYTRAEKEKGASGKPFKEIVFEYNHNLCKRVPTAVGGASSIGKLTLTKVTVKDYDRVDGTFRPYVFKYGYNWSTNAEDNALNPDFHYQTKDRWGTYKPQPTLVSGELLNDQFPYTPQGNEMDTYAKMWNLNKITTPSGSTIKVEYESDDYAYVQDRKAMRYFKVNHLEGSSYDDELYTGNDPNLRMVIDIDDHPIKGNLSLASAITDFKEKYLTRRDQNNFPHTIHFIMFNFGVYTKANASSKTERVHGYAKINPHSITLRKTGSTDYNQAVIDLEPVTAVQGSGMTKVSTKLHPITYIANQIGITALGKDVVPGQSNANGISFSDFGKMFASMGQLIKIMVVGVDHFFRGKNYFKKIDKKTSYVRLYEPDLIKKGGGHRVKRLLVFDNWDKMSKNGAYSEANAVYGVEYSYRKKPSPKSTAEISSGVVSYEPLTGGDENPFRETNQELIASNPGLFGRSQIKFEEHPFGELFIPGGSLVYSEVTTKSIEKTGVKINRTGKTKHQFYTAYDYPVGLRKTDPGQETPKPDPTFDFFSIHKRYSLNKTQGYSILLNDMHGKPKGVEMYAEDNENAYYKSTNHYSSWDDGVLDNVVPVVSKNGVISNRLIGIDVDMVSDAREVRNDVDVQQKAYNLNVVNYGQTGSPSYVPIPTYFPYRDTDEQIARTYAVTKVIQQYGILKKSVVKSEGSHLTSKNVLWDEETGNVIAQLSTNPKDESKLILSHSIPAHWYYEGMGLASKNIGITIPSRFGAAQTSALNSAGKIDNALMPYFYPGDEVITWKEFRGAKQGLTKYWVIEKKVSGGPNEYYLVDKNGGVFGSGNASMDNLSYIKIIRSGRRNHLGSTISSSSSTVASNFQMGNHFIPKTELLGTSAAEYSDHWQIYGNKLPSSMNISNEDCSIKEDQIVNPYIRGIRGVWRSNKSYVYRHQKSYASTSVSGKIGETDLKEDGKFNIPQNSDLFWQFNGGVGNLSKIIKGTTATNWLNAGEVTKVSAFGPGVETRDINNIYQSSQLGYGNTAVKANAVNARSTEIFFDGFEDREYLKSAFGNRFGCEVSAQEDWVHLAANKNPEITTGNAHSGKHALQLGHQEGVVLKVPVIEDNVTPTNPQNVPYQVKNSELITGFSPRRINQKQKYLMSFWIKSDANKKIDYSINGKIGSGKIQVSTSFGGVSTLQIENETQPIDGWKRVELSFEIPATTSDGELIIQLKNADVENMYIDDFRVHPYEAEMSAYVYDTNHQRLEAELDAQNFATFYEYDENGSLVRVKKETIRGIYTISETRGSIHKSN